MSPNNVQWYMLIRDISVPFLLIILAVSSGAVLSDYEVSKGSEWFFVVCYAVLCFGIISDINVRKKRINWYSVIYQKTGQVKITFWSDFWLKVWLILSMLLFVVGFCLGDNPRFQE